MFWFPTWSDTNQAVQLQKMARGLKFRIKKVEGLYYLCSETKALISITVTAKLICAKCGLSSDVAQISHIMREPAKTKVQISCTVTAQLIRVFVFAT